MSHMPMTCRLLISPQRTQRERERKRQQRGEGAEEGEISWGVWQVLKLYYATFCLGLTQTRLNQFKFMFGLSLHEFRKTFYTPFYIDSTFYKAFYIDSPFLYVILYR